VDSVNGSSVLTFSSTTSSKKRASTARDSQKGEEEGDSNGQGKVKRGK
jgi:hypothetical protein